MTKNEFEAAVKASKNVRAKHATSKKAALEYLMKLGMVDKDGKLTEKYRDKNAA